MTDRSSERRRTRTPGVAMLLATLPVAMVLVLLAGCSSEGRDLDASLPPAPSHTPSEPPPRTLSVVLNGDILLHEGLWSTARIDAARTGRGDLDFRPLLDHLRPVIRRADLAVCHLETPLAPLGGPYRGYPLFNAPPQIAPALRWAGYDACTTASNHSVDQGFAGLSRTLDLLHQAGLATAGTAATAAEAERPVVLERAGVRIGLVSATYGTNGMPVDADKPWAVNLLDVRRIKQQARAARAAGAEIVLVALHWGNEYQHAPSSAQQDVARRLARSADIDLIYGHHAHVVQPIEQVRGTRVIYGLGNALAQQDPKIEGVFDGLTVRVGFRETRPGHFEVSRLDRIPTMITHWVPGTTMRWYDIRRALRQPGKKHLWPQLRAALTRVVSQVGE